MDLRQSEYIVAIAECGNISKAAESLYITQSALNQQLIKLERELGLQLFYRDNRNIRLTQAGRIYVENSRELLRIKKNTYAILRDLKNEDLGEVTAGVTLGHGIDVFTAVFPRFNKRYPNITFNLLERHVADQQALLTSGKLDFGIVVLGEQDKDNLEYIPVFQEDLILGVSKQHPLAGLARKDGEFLPSIDLSLFRNETFALMFPNSTMRHIIDPAFESAGFKPKILIESGLVHALARMVSANLCCIILPHSKGRDSRFWDSIAWFRLSPPLSWCTYIAYRKNTHLTNAVKYFIQLAKEYGELTKARLQLERLPSKFSQTEHDYESNQNEAENLR